MSAREMEVDGGSRDFDQDQEQDREYRSRDERSASPRGARRGDSPPRARPRSISPGGRRSDERSAPPEGPREGSRGAGGSESGVENPGTNLFVMGIHPRLTEEDITRLFSKYGDVVKCQIMLDPHTRESRSFGFVEMSTIEQADSAREGLQGEYFEGRTLSIQKAKRGRPRTPTPGKYFGPPKRDDYRRPPPRYSSYDDRRGGGRSYGGGGRYGDYDRHYEDRRYEDRGYGGERRERGGESRRERGDYAGGREDRYGADDRYRRDERPRGGSSYYDREPRAERDPGYARGADDRGAAPAAGGAPPAESRSYYRDEAERGGYRR